eukprot:gene12625-biopygen2218
MPDILQGNRPQRKDGIGRMQEIVLGKEGNCPSRAKDGISKDGIPIAENRPRTKDEILKDEIK